MANHSAVNDNIGTAIQIWFQIIIMVQLMFVIHSFNGNDHLIFFDGTT